MHLLSRLFYKCLARAQAAFVTQIPQLDAAIPARAGQRASIRAEGESPDSISMGSPDPVQELAFLAPQPHFPPPSGGGPILAALADRHGGDSIEALSPDALLELCPSQIG